MVLEESVSSKDAAYGQLLNLWHTAPHLCTPVHTHAHSCIPIPMDIQQHYVGLVGLREGESKLMKQGKLVLWNMGRIGGQGMGYGFG